MTLTELLEKKGYSIYKLSKRTGIRESTYMPSSIIILPLKILNLILYIK